ERVWRPEVDHGGEPVTVEDQVHWTVIAVQHLRRELGQIRNEIGNQADCVTPLGKRLGGPHVERVRGARVDAFLDNAAKTIDGGGQVGQVDGEPCLCLR